jgi:hypothetical protein
MTTLVTAPADSAQSAAVLRPLPRTDLQLMTQQVAAIEQFNRARRLAQQSAAAAAHTREMRMDSERRLEVLRRQHDALVARAVAQLEQSGRPLGQCAPPRVLLAHRNAWFLDRVSSALLGRGLDVLARLDNGADAIGAAIADQPELVLVEDTLAMVPGEEVVREVLRYCPGTAVVAQVAYAEGIGPMLDAGAVAVHIRRVPPADVAAAMVDLVAA